MRKNILPECACFKQWRRAHHALVDVPVKYLGGVGAESGAWDFERFRVDALFLRNDFKEGSELSSFGPDATGNALVKLGHYWAKHFTSTNQDYVCFYEPVDNMPTLIPFAKAVKWIMPLPLQ